MNFWEKPIVGIYKITHRDTGKAYIGQSVDIFKRWKGHSNFAQAKKNWQVIKHALNKHGVAQFTFECSKEDLNDREIYWIKHFDTVSPAGYNLTSGGGGTLNPSEETRKKLSKAAKNRIVTDEARAAMSKAASAKIVSDEHKAAISEGMKKVVRTEEHKLNNAKANYKACVINDVEYESLKHAAEALGEHRATLARWLVGKHPWPKKKGLSGYYK